MNARYRKQMRLRSRHYRRGHTPWCHCPEPRQRMLLAFRRWQKSGRALPTRTLQPRMALSINRSGKPERVLTRAESEGAS